MNVRIRRDETSLDMKKYQLLVRMYMKSAKRFRVKKRGYSHLETVKRTQQRNTHIKTNFKSGLYKLLHC